TTRACDEISDFLSSPGRGCATSRSPRSSAVTTADSFSARVSDRRSTERGYGPSLVAAAVVSYTLPAIANPISVRAISAVICWMIGRHDYFGAGFLTVMMFALIADLASCRYVRVRLDRASARRARDRRVIARLDSLWAMTEARRREYIELHNLVDEI